MKVAILHSSKGSGVGKARNLATLEQWKVEHEEGYYGTPCGAEARRPQQIGNHQLKAGFIDRLTAVEVLLDLLPQLEETSLRRREVLEGLVDASIPIGGWLTSAGNLTLVFDCWEYRQGRRMGLRQAQTTEEADGVFYLETLCPDQNPDAQGIYIEGVSPIPYSP